MRFASVLHDGQPHAVAIDDQTAIPLTDIAELGALTPNELLSDPPLDRGAAFPLSEATVRPLVPRPGKVICVGLNYKAHIEETHRDDSDYPVLFTKFATSLTGAYDPIVCPPESSAIDYEGELASSSASHAPRGRHASPRRRRRLHRCQRRDDARLPVQDPPVAGPGQGLGRPPPHWVRRW